MTDDDTNTTVSAGDAGGDNHSNKSDSDSEGSNGSAIVSETTTKRRRPPTDKHHAFIFSVRRKVEIVQEAYSAPNLIHATARKYRIRRASIQQWKRNIKAIMEKAMHKPDALTANRGKPTENPNLEKHLVRWILSKRADNETVRPRDVINKALEWCPNFKRPPAPADRYTTKRVKNTSVVVSTQRLRLEKWVYPFLERSGLTIRRVTHVGHKLTGHLEKIRVDASVAFSSRMKPGGSLYGMPLAGFINMDQTAVYWGMRHNTTINQKGSTTVATSDGGTTRRATVFLAVAANGNKLPPFVVFEGKSCLHKFID